MSENSSIESSRVHFKPEVAFSPERSGRQTIEIIADPVSGEILKSGDPGDVRLWIVAEKSRTEMLGQKPPKLKEVRGGLVIPGLIDSHNHPFLYSGLEIANPEDVSGVQTKEELIGRLRAKVAEREKGTYFVATGLNTTSIHDLTANDLDAVSADHKVIVYDPSYHGCVVNHVALTDVERFGREYQNLIKTVLRGEIKENGQMNEDWVYMTWELIETEGGLEKLTDLAEKAFEKSLASGVTGIHDMELATYNEVIAFLMLRKKWGEGLPVRQVYLQPRTLKYLETQVEDLRSRGFDPDEIKKLFGFKLYADGSIGTRTANLSSPYGDAKTSGIEFYSDEKFNEALRLAREHGLQNIAVHAIGDRGIRRAVEAAQRWQRLAQEGNLDPRKFRIDHFEMPDEESLEKVRDLGTWVCPQPNFLTDYIYKDRLGEERLKMLCPHQKILGYKIPMMFGTDGMPSSALFAIWMATHAPEESQRLTFEEALLASTLASGRYMGENGKASVGSLAAGQRADIIVADPKLLETLTSSERPDPREVPMGPLIESMDHNIQKVYLRGRLVYSK